MEIQDHYQFLNVIHRVQENINTVSGLFLPRVIVTPLLLQTVTEFLVIWYQAKGFLKFWSLSHFYKGKKSRKVILRSSVSSS